jgi:hypothetical protein
MKLVLKTDFSVDEPENGFAPLFLSLPVLVADPNFNAVIKALLHNNLGVFRKRHVGHKAFPISYKQGKFGRQFFQSTLGFV